jgi:hypothetical protein
LPPDYIGSIKHLGGRVWLDFYRHGISRLAEQDAYAGYMVSLHSDGLLTQGRHYTRMGCSLRGGVCSPTCPTTRSIRK